MVIDEGDYYSVCEHHMMPFYGHYWFAYVPNPKGKILGISKVGRAVDYCAARLQVQERLTHDIVDMLTEALGTENPPLGVALVMKGHHLCKEMRGVKKKGLMTSSYLTGIFLTKSEVRNEFMNFVNYAKTN
jgi:GTP cyclohydrolase I